MFVEETESSENLSLPLLLFSKTPYILWSPDRSSLSIYILFLCLGSILVGSLCWSEKDCTVHFRLNLRFTSNLRVELRSWPARVRGYVMFDCCWKQQEDFNQVQNSESNFFSNPSFPFRQHCWQVQDIFNTGRKVRFKQGCARFSTFEAKTKTNLLLSGDVKELTRVISRWDDDWTDLCIAQIWQIIDIRDVKLHPLMLLLVVLSSWSWHLTWPVSPVAIKPVVSCRVILSHLVWCPSLLWLTGLTAVLVHILW